jgi:surfactin synthase thioesterase subunit
MTPIRSFRITPPSSALISVPVESVRTPEFRTQALAEINHFANCPIGTPHHGQIEVEPLIGSPQILKIVINNSITRIMMRIVLQLLFFGSSMGGLGGHEGCRHHFRATIGIFRFLASSVLKRANISRHAF